MYYLICPGGQLHGPINDSTYFGLKCAFEENNPDKTFWVIYKYDEYNTRIYVEGYPVYDIKIGRKL